MFIGFLKEYAFALGTTLLLVLLVCGSYYRFIVLNDYLVAYEGDCDPDTQSCYEYCEEEDDCYQYSIIEWYAADLVSLCGHDEADCDAIYECEESGMRCEVIYCDPEVESEDICVSYQETS